MSAHDEAVEAGLSAFNTHNAHREPWQMTHAHELDAAAACVRAYLAHMAAAGWKLTPREATEVMRAAMTRLNHPHDHELWEAAHDAAPSPEEAHER